MSAVKEGPDLTAGMPQTDLGLRYPHMPADTFPLGTVHMVLYSSFTWDLNTEFPPLHLNVLTIPVRVISLRLQLSVPLSLRVLGTN